MSLISTDVKEQIINNLNNILNIQDSSWNNLDPDIKIKIIHNLCSLLKKNTTDLLKKNTTDLLNDDHNNTINIPLKNLRPKKLIQFCGMNKQSNTIVFDEFRKNIINVNKEFRNNYNSSNNNYCFGNLSKNKYENLLNSYNYNIYVFLVSNINIINSKNLYNNLIGENQHKIIPNNLSNNFQDGLKIKQINYKDKFLNIEFKNSIQIQLELYLTSEKITNNIPAKYKINLINIF